MDAVQTGFLGPNKTPALKTSEVSQTPAIIPKKTPEADVNCAHVTLRQSCFHASTASGKVHPTAIVHPDVEIPSSSSIGAYSIIDSGGVTVGENCSIKSHVVVSGNTKLGDNCTIFPFSVNR